MAGHSKGRDVGSGMAVGVALGLALGAAFDNIGVGVALGIAVGAALGTAYDRDANGDADDEGAIDRGVLWLLVGLGVAVLLVLVTAPELIAADPRFLGQLLLVAVAAAIPGALVFTFVAIRRRHRLDDEER